MFKWFYLLSGYSYHFVRVTVIEYLYLMTFVSSIPAVSRPSGRWPIGRLGPRCYGVGYFCTPVLCTDRLANLSYAAPLKTLFTQGLVPWRVV